MCNSACAARSRTSATTTTININKDSIFNRNNNKKDDPRRTPLLLPDRLISRCDAGILSCTKLALARELTGVQKLWELKFNWVPRLSLSMCNSTWRPEGDAAPPTTPGAPTHSSCTVLTGGQGSLTDSKRCLLPFLSAFAKIPLSRQLGFFRVVIQSVQAHHPTAHPTSHRPARPRRRVWSFPQHACQPAGLPAGALQVRPFRPPAPSQVHAQKGSGR